MKTSVMVLLIIAVSLVAVGLILCVVGLALSPGETIGEKFLSLGKSDFVSEETVVSEEISGLDLQVSTARVEILKATDGVTKVALHERVQEKSEVTVKDGVLTIRPKETEWYKKISFFSFGTSTVTVYLAEPMLETVQIKTSTGNVRVAEEIAAKNASVEFSTAKIDFFGSASEMLRIHGSTGDVRVSGSFGEVAVQTSTGDITLGGSAETVTIKVSTGEIDLERLTVTGAMTLWSSTGDISIEDCSVASATITTDTGDVKGRFTSPMIFFATSDTGRVRVPESTEGGLCKITTDTGNIIFE